MISLFNSYLLFNGPRLDLRPVVERLFLCTDEMDAPMEDFLVEGGCAIDIFAPGAKLFLCAVRAPVLVKLFNGTRLLAGVASALDCC